MPLWPHQAAALGAAQAAIAAGRKSGLLVLPTGTGKTVVFTVLAKRLGLPTMVVVHRDELIRQTLAAASLIWPAARQGVIQGKRDEWRDGEQLLVASVQSLHRRRLEQMPRDRFGLVVVDEAHHAPARIYSDVIDHFEPRFLLGVTATADRLDGVGLAGHFGGKPLFSYSLRQAIADGRLVRVKQLAVETATDLDDVRSRMGDFVEGDLADAINTPERNRTVVEAYLEHARGRKAITFCAGLEHVADLTRVFAAAGVRAAAVTGKMEVEQRREVLADFKAGRFEVLTNCQVLTEGYDERSVSCVLMARPTASRSLYTQCVGRGFRLCPETNKEDCIVLDFVDNCHRHKLFNVLNLLGAKKACDARGGDALAMVEEEEEAEREAEAAAERFRVEHPVRWKATEVSPWADLPSLAGYRPTGPWCAEPPSEKQFAYLCRRFELDPDRPLTRGQASYLIDQCMQREALLPATPNQVYCLRRLGRWRPGLTRQQASEIIGRYKAGVN
jgi:superfamily II DNA or RNA helicase